MLCCRCSLTCLAGLAGACCQAGGVAFCGVRVPSEQSPPVRLAKQQMHESPRRREQEVVLWVLSQFHFSDENLPPKSWSCVLSPSPGTASPAPGPGSFPWEGHLGLRSTQELGLWPWSESVTVSQDPLCQRTFLTELFSEEYFPCFSSPGNRNTPRGGRGLSRMYDCVIF